MPLVTPKQAQSLVATIQEGSVRAAADRLQVEASTISRQIAALEKLLAMPLVERSRRGVIPTEAGRMVFDFLMRQEDESDVLLSGLNALRGLQRGTLSVAVGEGFIGDFVGSSLKAFAADYPEIRFKISGGSTEQVTRDVMSDHAHIGLAYNVKPAPQLHVLAEAVQPLMLIAAPGSRFAEMPEPVRIEDLADAPCALLTRGFGVADFVSAFEAQSGFRFRSKVETTSFAVLKSFAREGLGVTFLPRFVVVREISDGYVVARRIAAPEFALGKTHLFIRRGRRLPEIAERFSRHLIRSMTAYT